MTRYELVDGTSSKFWEVQVVGSTLTTRWGRIGTAGQTKAKAFASDALARKERDALVAEKLGKGYRETGGNGSAVAPAAPGPPPAAVPVIRQDIGIYNEATGFLVTSARLRGKELDSGTDEWDAAVRRGDLLPFELVQDDPFVIRVVVGGALEPDEEAQWVGRLSWKLRVPDGRLAVCAGSEFVMDPWDPDEDEDDHGAEYRHLMPVPAGTYHATLYGFLQGINGENLLARAGGLARGWPKEGPDEGPPLVEFLLHLQPEGAAPLPPKPPETEDGWFSWNVFETRRPAEYPPGVVARDVVHTARDEEREAEPPAGAVRVAAHVADRALQPIDGGPVPFPTTKLAQLYRLSWFACGATHPEVLIQHSNAKNLAAFFNPLAGVEAEVDGSRLSVGFPAGYGRWETLERLESFSSQWANMPDGTVLELVACAPPVEERPVREHGLVRFRGRLEGRLDTSVWHLSEAYPPVSAATLRAALALADGADERELEVPSEALAKATAGRWKRLWAWEHENKLSVAGTTLRFKRADHRAQLLLAACAFRAAHAGTWSVFLEEDEVGPEDVGATSDRPTRDAPATKAGPALADVLDALAQLATKAAAPESITGAASDGDVEAVAAFLAADPGGVGEKSVGFASPLQAAANAGQDAVVDMLLARGADAREKKDAVGSPLAGALRWGHEMFDRLLAATPDVSGERHALVTAAFVGELGPLRALLDRGAAKFARYALKMAAESGQYSAAKMLLEAAPDWKEYPALRIPQAAHQAGHTEIHKLLMGQPHDEAKALAVEKEKKEAIARSRAQVRENVAKRTTPPAERRRLLGLVREAVAAGVLGPKVIDKPQVAAGDWGKVTPLMAACRSGDVELVEALLAAGATATVKIARAQTARHFARGPHRERILDLLAQHGERKPTVD
jgi:predicted DNA-binding WGR domain protein/ankyrin repeat protein